MYGFKRFCDGSKYSLLTYYPVGVFIFSLGTTVDFTAGKQALIQYVVVDINIPIALMAWHSTKFPWKGTHAYNPVHWKGMRCCILLPTSITPVHLPSDNLKLITFYSGVSFKVWLCQSCRITAIASQDVNTCLRYQSYWRCSHSINTMTQHFIPFSSNWVKCITLRHFWWLQTVSYLSERKCLSCMLVSLTHTGEAVNSQFSFT